jgi:hypothetical protein
VRSDELAAMSNRLAALVAEADAVRRAARDCRARALVTERRSEQTRLQSEQLLELWRRRKASVGAAVADDDAEGAQHDAHVEQE